MEIRNRCAFAVLALGALLMAGCKNADNKAQTPEDRGEKWERIQGEKSVALKLHAKNTIQMANRPITPILYVGCGNLATIIAVRAPGDFSTSKVQSSKVRLTLDGATAVEQQWVDIVDKTGESWSPESAEARLHLLLQILKAKGLSVDLTSDDGSSRTANFELLDFKDRFTHEPSCAAWRDPSRYQ